MTAIQLSNGLEVAVKFIVKSKVPEHAWIEDDVIGRLPTEVLLLSYVEHKNIVKCLDLFEDELYFYLVCPSFICFSYRLPHSCKGSRAARIPLAKDHGKICFTANNRSYTGFKHGIPSTSYASRSL